MRKLFRVYDKDRKEYLSAGTISIEIHKGKNPVIKIILDHSLDVTNSDRFVIEQYTGFKDINGKEIYEGDIVNFTKPWKDRNAVIGFYNGSFWLEDNIYGLRLLSDRSACIKVIGNIYENEKLLEKD